MHVVERAADDRVPVAEVEGPDAEPCRLVYCPTNLFTELLRRRWEGEAEVDGNVDIGGQPRGSVQIAACAPNRCQPESRRRIARPNAAKSSPIGEGMRSAVEPAFEVDVMGQIVGAVGRRRPVRAYLPHPRAQRQRG
jgi:hypothetical protein